MGLEHVSRELTQREEPAVSLRSTELRSGGQDQPRETPQAPPSPLLLTRGSGSPAGQGREEALLHLYPLPHPHAPACPEESVVILWDLAWLPLLLETFCNLSRVRCLV